MTRTKRAVALVDEESMAAWKEAAAASKLSLSTWMLLTLNKAATTAAEKGNRATRSKAA